MPRSGTARRASSNTLSADGLSPAVSSTAPTIPVPYHRDPLAALAEFIISRYRDTLPDLSRCVVLLPNLLAAPWLRRLLLDEAGSLGHKALLGPTILTLPQWLNDVATPPMAPLSPQARELILVETLHRHRGLFRDSDPWLLAGNLLELFAQLTLHRVTLPAELDTFIKRLGDAYGLGNRAPAALSMEAKLVHTLWHAWHRQLRDEGRLDPQAAYITQLDDSLAAVDPNTHLYIVDHVNLTPPEQRWAERLGERGQLTLISHGGIPDEAIGDPYTQYLDEVFAGMAADSTPAPLKERAHRFAAQHTASPARERLLVYAAPHAEAEARAVDIQVRRWLLQGKRRIAIVSDDRKLARRVRALLERADVALHDAAGWALSTTAAASALERWLETVEEDFAYRPLTDLLKSPFTFPQQDRDELLAAVYRFEQDLVFHENIPRNLQRYRKHLAYRRARWPQAAGTAVEALLNDVEEAAKPLLPLVRGGRTQVPQRWLDALEESLQRLGMTETFAEDAAGDRILQELKVMRQALAGRHLKMGWREFRTWLGRTLERFNFQPPTAAAAVQLLGLEQSALAHYDALIIAGATAQHLPGAGEPAPFFNEAVRRELGLPGFQQRYDTRFHYFRGLLQAAPQVLVTARREEAGEPVLLSPWLEALQAFHRFAYDAELSDDGLAALVDHPANQVIRSDSDALPAPKGMPAPAAPAALLPDKISASTYQQLMDCPYQFFAACCLQLTAPEEVREALEKSDYGNRIHTALRAFHSTVDGYPEPFQQAITVANRAAAIARLEEISQAVFAKDLEDNFMHRGWLQRWRQLIPDYIDWQIAREQNWRVTATEAKMEIQRLALHLKGRIDRIDHGAEGNAIVDYKTGTTPGKDEVTDGEAVQLPFYALLSDDLVQRVEYLRLEGHRFGSQAVLEGEDLHDLIADNGKRLHTVMQQMADGAPLPAWGDDDTCRYCAMAGVCRRDVWQGEATEGTV